MKFSEAPDGATVRFAAFNGTYLKTGPKHVNANKTELSPGTEECEVEIISLPKPKIIKESDED